MSRRTTTRDTVHQLLRAQHFGVLSTAGENGPHASLVAFTVSDDDRHLYFATPRTTRKFANIIADKRVALLVNNSANRPEDFQTAAAVTAVGIATAVNPSELDTVRDEYLSKHPHLEAFAYSPTSEFMAVQVQRYTLVERFQNVTEYMPGGEPNG